MAKMSYSKSQFDVPDGKYLARFLGTEDLPDQGKMGLDGKPMPPAMAWEFEVAEGEHRGKKVGRVTGRQPTPKSGCGKMLSALTDRVLRDGEEFETDDFKGRTYRITVTENRVSDSPPPVFVPDPGAGPPTAPAAPASPGVPPPYRARPTPVDDFWAALPPDFEKPVKLARHALQDLIDAQKLDIRELAVIRHGESDWKTAADYGFTEAVPF